MTTGEGGGTESHAFVTSPLHTGEWLASCPKPNLIETRQSVSEMKHPDGNRRILTFVTLRKERIITAVTN